MFKLKVKNRIAITASYRKRKKDNEYYFYFRKQTQIP